MQRSISLQIHIAEVVLRAIRIDHLHGDYNPVAQKMNIASKVEGITKPVSIVFSEPTFRFAEGSSPRLRGGFDAVSRLLVRENRYQLLERIFKDLQWLGRETAAFLEFLPVASELSA